MPPVFGVAYIVQVLGDVVHGLYVRHALELGAKLPYHHRELVTPPLLAVAVAGACVEVAEGATCTVSFVTGRYRTVVWLLDVVSNSTSCMGAAGYGFLSLLVFLFFLLQAHQSCISQAM